MNVTAEIAKDWGYGQHFDKNAQYLQMIFGTSESLFCFDTYQFKDYTKVLATRFDAAHKAQRRQEVFPQDCQKAFEMGARFARQG